MPKAHSDYCWEHGSVIQHGSRYLGANWCSKGRVLSLTLAPTKYCDEASTEGGIQLQHAINGYSVKLSKYKKWDRKIDESSAKRARALIANKHTTVSVVELRVIAELALKILYKDVHKSWEGYWWYALSCFTPVDKSIKCSACLLHDMAQRLVTMQFGEKELLALRDYGVTGNVALCLGYAYSPQSREVHDLRKRSGIRLLNHARGIREYFYLLLSVVDSKSAASKKVNDLLVYLDSRAVSLRQKTYAFNAAPNYYPTIWGDENYIWYTYGDLI